MIDMVGRVRPAALAITTMALMIAAAMAVAVGAWTDRANRAHGPESAFATYAEALARRDLQDALDQVAPDARQDSASFVEWQMGNRYVVLEIVVRTDSLLAQWVDRGTGDVDLVVTMDVHGHDGSLWRTTEVVPAVRSGGRWFLSKPPLSPDS